MLRAKGKRKTQDPCEGCLLHRSLCLCSEIRRLATVSRLSLVIHSKEMRRTTNTGLLAIRALVNSEIFVRGLQGAPLDLTRSLVPEYRHLLFYPCDEAIDLSTIDRTIDSRPIHLIVPDGNWRQASKVASRQPELAAVQRVMVKTPNTAVHHMRVETTEVGMATLQAIAQAFSVIESREVGDALERLYQLKLARTLEGRGLIKRLSQ
jgi:DTW domain-containing protein